MKATTKAPSPPIDCPACAAWRKRYDAMRADRDRLAEALATVTPSRDAPSRVTPETVTRHASTVTPDRDASRTAAAERSRRYRQRRKSGT